MFKGFYRRQFRELFGEPLASGDGLGDQGVRSRVEQFGLTIPAALADYYAVAGRHWINENHNRLRPIEALEWMDDRLVFLEENQEVAFWGIDRADLGQADPIVWQGVNGDPVEWYPEDFRLSRFLMAMWKWTLTGELEPPAATA